MLTKILSTIFLFCVLVASLIVAMVDLLTGHDILPIVQDILFAGLSYTAAIVGVHTGVELPTGAPPSPPQQPASIHEIDTAIVPAVRLPPAEGSHQ